MIDKTKDVIIIKAQDWSVINIRSLSLFFKNIYLGMKITWLTNHPIVRVVLLPFFGYVFIMLFVWELLSYASNEQEDWLSGDWYTKKS